MYLGAKRNPAFNRIRGFSVLHNSVISACRIANSHRNSDKGRVFPLQVIDGKLRTYQLRKFVHGIRNVVVDVSSKRATREQ